MDNDGNYENDYCACCLNPINKKKVKNIFKIDKK